MFFHLVDPDNEYPPMMLNLTSVEHFVAFWIYELLLVGGSVAGTICNRGSLVTRDVRWQGHQ